MTSLDLRFVRSPPKYHPPSSGAINLSVTRILLHAHGLGICPQRVVAQHLNISKESLSRFGGKVGFQWPFNRLKGANRHKALVGSENVWIEMGIAHLLNTTIYENVNAASYDAHDEATVMLFRTVLPASKKRGMSTELKITTRVRLIRAGSKPCVPETCSLPGRHVVPPPISLAHLVPPSGVREPQVAATPLHPPAAALVQACAPDIESASRVPKKEENVQAATDQRTLFDACNALGILGEMAKSLPDPPVAAPLVRSSDPTPAAPRHSPTARYPPQLVNVGYAPVPPRGTWATPSHPDASRTSGVRKRKYQADQRANPAGGISSVLKVERSPTTYVVYS